MNRLSRKLLQRHHALCWWLEDHPDREGTMVYWFVGIKIKGLSLMIDILDAL